MISTKCCYVYLLKSKDEAIEKFILHKNEVENQLNEKIKELKSNWGGEYQASFSEFFALNEIVRKVMARYLPQQNSVAKRKIRTLRENNGYNVVKFWKHCYIRAILWVYNNGW